MPLNIDRRSERTRWFKEAKWGVFCHYLAAPASSSGDGGLSSDEWNSLVDSFDTERLASQLQSVGAKYFFITLGQNTGHYCSPNDTYDEIVGLRPSKCSRRDLVSDISDALEPRGIRLLTYLPSGAPRYDTQATEKLCWRLHQSGPVGQREPGRLAEFQTKWESIIREWSLRWGRKVSGWWIDGCYFSEEMYNHPEPPNFQSFADALRAGNPDRILAFNPGIRIPVISLTEHEDYTAGELADSLQLGQWRHGYQPIDSQVDGAQYHVLNFLGSGWGRGEPRFPDAMTAGYTRYVVDHGGVVTWDVPISFDGQIPEGFLRQLRAVREAL